ncbi:hypothetical protein Mp_Vg00710 [Marchantia polymorpha subsp. ruderalis]|uniref:Mediator complex subunit Med12 domain-containing protein n=2 Tax=Marchantia polymorpha TaxID=3197 RepID=A0A2R6VX50_MARPO|nr:hypothetical protein MARPO_YA0045 [Marchantia polymorpha]PTQ26186.1 hypothetical protein MARPO_YA0045 [Marchantia polymorpha]BBN20580.1 hypothetical protein Mp_Vg00710 [Marchantia polymorpha subsp. ruderalis]BBN20581.1 hypothetical protein Mp_Vg00710 [Marchantia polymorpha subsp. ruderalis]|eukprot:PTQ26182.1 hypothetical protein MARPO_YA0045 [Marchantia polymorpha]
MHRYSSAGSTSGLGNNSGAGSSSREMRGSESSFSSSTSFSLSSRRTNQQLVAYKLKCEREPLSVRLGPPDFYPPAPNCAEEVLNRDSCVNGYKEIIDGVEESNEAKLSLTSQAYNSLWNKQNVNRYKEAIRKRLRALNNALVRKRKAGQVYALPLTGSLLAKPGIFPEQRTCGEDFRKKWIEDLSQRKRLRSLAEHVPHGYRRRSLFEALIKHEVPLIRATWFVKILYLNQVRPLSIGMSAGGPDKSQAKRVELWTKDVLEYAQSLLDEFCTIQAASITSRHSPKPVHGSDVGQSSTEVGESELQVKWRYLLRLAHWHHSEGLLHRVQLVDWALKQLQEKESVEALEILLPIILKVIDGLSLSQTHVRVLVDLCLRWLQKFCSTGTLSSVHTRPQLLHCATILKELLRYLLLVVPDTFVALDCLPLPACVCPIALKGEKLISAGDGENKDTKCAKVSLESAEDMREYRNEMIGRGEFPGLEISAKVFTHRDTLIGDVIDGIQKRAASLARAVNPGLLRNNEGKVVQGLDKALSAGDVQGACRCVFDEDFCSSEQLPDDWQADVNVGFGRTPTLLTNVNSSELFAIRFLCEWAVCDFRDSRGRSSSYEKKSVCVRDMSRVYMAVSVLRTRMEELNDKRSSSQAGVSKSQSERGGKKDGCWRNLYESNLSGEIAQDVGLNANLPPFSESLHDLIVAWLDQHELRRGESSERLQLLLSELVREHLFCPKAYVRQLLCSGVLEKNDTLTEKSRAARHKLLLRNLPCPPSSDGSNLFLLEASRLYRNERSLALRGYSRRHVQHGEDTLGVESYPPQQQPGGILGRIDLWLNSVSERSCVRGQDNGSSCVSKKQKRETKILELKQSIATCLQFPDGTIDPAASPVLWSRKVLKRQATSPCNSLDKIELTPGCEECSRNKRTRTNDAKASIGQVMVHASHDDEESWWLRKGQKALEAVKVEPLLKPPVKQNTRGRPKTVRKTQSLAQLAAARIESGQGASSSHACDSRVNCPFHRSALEGVTNISLREKSKHLPSSDVRAIGTSLGRLRLNEKKVVASWLDLAVRRLVTGGDSSCTPQIARNSSALGSAVPLALTESGTSNRWRMNEEQLGVIVYILDVANDFHTLIGLVLWLLPAAPVPPTTPPGHGSRGMPTTSLMRDTSACDVGEAVLLSSLRRYEGFIAAMDLLPQALSAGMQRASNLMTVVPGGRAGCSALLCYVRDLLRKYGGLASVQAWEKNWKVTCDQRLVAELEALKAGDSEGGFGMVGLSSDDRDDPVPQRLTGRLNRFGVNLKEIVQRGISEAVLHMMNKEREASSCSGMKEGAAEKTDDGLLAAQRVVSGVMDTIRQNGSGVMQADSALVASAVTFIVSNAGAAIANVFESLGTSNHSNVGLTGSGSSFRCARRVLLMHMLCLRLLKEALGDRHSRMVEIALGAEASSSVLHALQHASGRFPRTPYHLSPETPENSGLANESGNVANFWARTNITAAAVTALVAGVIIQGTTTLERMISVLKIRENLESLQISKSAGGSSNGISRSTSSSINKEHLAEAHLYWFRVLIGNCRMAGGGLVADLLGESNAMALARMQRLMPLTVAFPPAYALFGAALRRQPSSYIGSTVREDPVVQSAIYAVNEVVAHEPFRDVCLRDTRALYLLLSSDSGESEYAAMLDMQGLDARSKGAAMVPLRARLFLHALLDRGLPASLLQDEDTWSHGRGDFRNRFPNEPRQLEQLVQVLDDLQPATYHWQWVELRLLLNEQMFIEKLDGQSALEAVHAAAAGSDTGQLSECEKTFTEVVLTRLLVRPDAAALYSEAVHSLGRALEEYLILQVKWVLEGTDMLLGRKSLHQLLDNIAQRQGFSVGTRRVPAWGWQPPGHGGDKAPVLGSEKKKVDTASPEEGELAEDGSEWRKREEKQKGGGHAIEQEAPNARQFAIEKALADLVLPCLARSSNETCNGFAFELIKQMSTLEQQITLIARSVGKTFQAASAGGESVIGKGVGVRRGARAGFDTSSPGIGRKFVGASADSSAVSAAALQTSMWLRLQFLLPLLPIIHTDRDQTGRNMRQTLAPVLLRLLGTRVVQEATEPPHLVFARDLERNAEASSATATAAAGEGLFDRLLSVLHALLSSTWAVWLKPRPTSKVPSKPLREVPPFDREVAERMQRCRFIRATEIRVNDREDIRSEAIQERVERHRY